MPLCQRESVQNHSYEDVLPLQVHFHANQTQFHMKAFERGFVWIHIDKVSRNGLL